MERAREAAELSHHHSEVDAEFTRVKSSFKGRLDDLVQGIAECLKDVRDGTEQRVVDLEDHFDYTDGVVRTFHGGELIDVRPVTAEERQTGIKFIEKADAADKIAQAEVATTGFANTGQETPAPAA
jgi:hypothetical protein